MTRLRLGLARAATFLTTILLWTWLAVKVVVALIGATTVGDDYNQMVERLPAVLTWLFSTPWWVPAGLATALTAFLIWLSWPRNSPPNLGERPASEAKATVETSPIKNADNEVSKDTHNELVWFCADYLLPACEAQIALQKQMIKELTKSGYVEMYAWRGAVDHYRTFGFWDSFEKLSAGLTQNRTPFSFNEIAECATGAGGNYKTFCDQMHLISNEGKILYKQAPTTGPLWECWRTKHNALIEQYEKLKRDARLFGLPLFRPSKEQRLGEIIEKPADIFG